VGGVDYITKPFQVEEVLARVEMHLALRQARKKVEEKNAALEREIAERVQVEQALRESEQKFRSIVENSLDGIILTDEAGNVTAWNKGAEQVVGIKRSDVLGRPLWDVQFQVVPEEQKTPATFERLKGMLLDFFERGHAPWANQALKQNIIHADGTRRVAESAIFPIQTAQGFRAASIMRDVTTEVLAQEALVERLQFEALIADLSARFINLSADDVDEEITRGLEQIVEFLDIDRSAMFKLAPDGTPVHVTHLHTADGIRSFPRRLRKEQFPWHTKKLRQGQIIMVSRVSDDLPDEEERAKKIADREGVKSYIVIPLTVGGVIRYALGVAALRFEQTWSDELVQRLGIVGEIFVNALTRKRAEDELKSYHDHLEELVAERTVKLQRANAGLAREISERIQTEEALRESESKYRALAENSPDIIMRFDREYRHLYTNTVIEDIVAIPAEGFLSKTNRELGFTPDQAAFWEGSIQKVFDSGNSLEQRFDFEGMQSKMIFNWRLVPEFDAEGNVQTVLSISRNITERKRAEDALRESEHYLQEAQAMAQLGHWKLIPETEKVSGSDELFRIFGLTREQATLDAFAEIVHPDDREYDLEHIRRGIEYGEPWDIEHRLICRDGTLKHVQAKGEAITDDAGKTVLFIGTVQDITARVQVEEQIRTSLEEKKVLLQELYHRTRNNMGVIKAMLALQAARTKDEKVKSILKEMENRIRSMSLAHQKLYQSQDLSRIDLGEYIADLVPLLAESHGVLPDKIALTLDTESVPVLIDSAIPCGLVLNELLSNAFTHAFPGERSGEVQVRLRQQADGPIMLQISDDGIGVPEDFDFEKSDSLGLQMVFGIIKSQLQGDVVVETERGIAWQIQFRDDLYSPRV
ncbi:MAG: PAS domain S-box protein, partial [Proteobacteria bacterium]|nr:PAS domain S-box protein [Pseudomonadota bacterium]